MEPAAILRDFVLPVAILLVAVVALWRERQASMAKGEALAAKHDEEVKSLLAEIRRIDGERISEATSGRRQVTEALNTNIEVVRGATAAIRAVRTEKEKHDE